jgi:hypothetical protein
VSLWRYVTSSAYAVDVMENWQSEYLQFTLFILGTVWLVQRGSTESSRSARRAASPTPTRRSASTPGPTHRRWPGPAALRTFVYSNSLVADMAAIWLASWFAQLLTGRIEYNADQLDHLEAPLTLGQYAGTSDFWNRTLQNWQSEFLAVASLVVFSTWLRQRGSAQSKPVGESHESTGAQG